MGLVSIKAMMGRWNHFNQQNKLSFFIFYQFQKPTYIRLDIYANEYKEFHQR